MRSTARTVAVVVGLLIMAGLSAAAQRGTVETEIAQLIDQWAEARVKGDTVFLERFYAAELSIGQMNGALIDRNDDIALFAARRIKPEYIRSRDVHVAVHGETAIVSRVESLKGTYDGRPGEMSLRMLEVLVRRDGRWQLIAAQSAPIATPQVRE